jgi:hypothetical protein
MVWDTISKKGKLHLLFIDDDGEVQIDQHYYITYVIKEHRSTLKTTILSMEKIIFVVIRKYARSSDPSRLAKRYSRSYPIRLLRLRIHVGQNRQHEVTML